MQAQKNTTHHLQKLASHLFNFGMVTGLATLTFGLISCGGGGGGGGGTSGGSSSSTPTINAISPSGLVASSGAQAITIYGTNFASGMNLNIASSSGVTAGYTITSSSVLSSTSLAVSAVITAAPADRYAVFAIKSSTGTTTLASTVLGVASTAKTLTANIQSIFTTKCAPCHTAGAAGSMNLDDASLGGSTGVIDEPSVGCSSVLRVKAGDPRRSSSFLIDKIQAAPTGIAPCSGSPMTGSPTTLTTQDIADIIDWVAGGAN